MNRLSSIIAALLLAAAIPEAQAIYQCRDASGKLAFQDMPCAAHQTQERVIKDAPGKDGPEIREIPLVVPGAGRVVVLVPADWEYTVRQPNPALPPVVRIRADGPDGRISLQFNFFADKAGRFDSPDKVAQAVVAGSRQYVAGSVQGRVELKPLQSPAGFGAYAQFSERARPVPPDFRHVTSGLFNARGTLYNFTLLSDDLESSNHEIAMVLLLKGVVAETAL